MKIKLLCLTATLFLSAGLALSGCELEEECDPAVDAGCIPADAGTDAGGGTDTGVVQDTGTPQFQTYHYVLIEDTEDPSTSSPTSTAGVDIFGVQLVAGGQTFNASDFHVCTFGSGDNAHARDCNQALGVPVGDCSTTRTADYVALGGRDGGRIIVSFGALEEIQTGDTIIVHECGAAQNPGATAEEYNSFVGISTDPTANTWVPCHQGATGVGQCTVPNLPQIPLN